jgi:protein ImuB
VSDHRSAGGYEAVTRVAIRVPGSEVAALEHEHTFAYTEAVLIALHLPRFAFDVTAARLGLDGSGIPAAIAPEPGGGTLVSHPSRTAEIAGIRTGMRLTEALSLCPGLALLPPDPLAVDEAAETLVRRIEDLGLPVEPIGPGHLLADSSPVLRLYRGLDKVIDRLQLAGGGRARLGAASTRFAALAAARRARPRRALVWRDEDVELSARLAPLPVDVLVSDAGVDPAIVEVLRSLGLRTLGDTAVIGRVRLRDRFGPAGARIHDLVTGRDVEPIRPRPLPQALVERIELTEPATTEQMLARAFDLLLERLLGHPHRRARQPRTLVPGARLVGGGSWSSAITLREPSAEPALLRTALHARLREIPAPAIELSLELRGLARGDLQLPLVRAEGAAKRARLDAAVRQVRSTLGERAALRVVEVDAESRLPERRFGLAPR